jgi:hypothetical protein
MTHKEAIKAAVDAGEGVASMLAPDEATRDEADDLVFIAMFRAYLDARGLVIVPKEPTQAMLDEVTAADQSEPFSEMTMNGIYWQMLAAAPDPFKNKA